jgi:hypothetical protein
VTEPTLKAMLFAWSRGLGSPDLSVQESAALSVGHVASCARAPPVLYASEFFAAAVLPELVAGAARALAGARERVVRQVRHSEERPLRERVR